MVTKRNTIDPERYKKVEEAFKILDSFLEGQDYVAGRNLTIADRSCFNRHDFDHRGDNNAN